MRLLTSTMKAKRLFLLIAALVAVGVLWLARSAWGSNTSQTSNADIGPDLPDVHPKPGQMLRPPDPIRKYRDLTPEQRVQQARHPVGG
jgi:hypothetical protein